MTIQSRLSINDRNLTEPLHLIWSDLADPYLLRQFYTLLTSYVTNVLSYQIDDTTGGLQYTDTDLARRVYNPVPALVEFYAAKLWPGTLPGAMPIVTENDRIIDPIHQIWQWSNWSINKQVFARWLPSYGDPVIQVATKRDSSGRPSQVYMKLINPRYVTRVKQDNVGNIVFIRLDIPRVRTRIDEEEVAYVHTEAWDKRTQTARIWKHTHAINTRLAVIPRSATEGAVSDDPDWIPYQEESFSQTHGEDYVPFVRAEARADGRNRAPAVFTSEIVKIHSANIQVERLLDIAFRNNKALWALMSNSHDSDGIPLPPPKLDGAAGDDGRINTDDGDIWRVTGADLQALVPNMQYAEVNGIIDSLKQHIMQNLPELMYYEIAQLGGNISGVAVRQILDPAISRVVEVRGNGESAMVTAQQMALDIGQRMKLPGFTNIGNYDDGDLDHAFADRPVVSDDELEVLARRAGVYQALGSVPGAAAVAGFTEDEQDALRLFSPQDAL